MVGRKGGGGVVAFLMLLTSCWGKRCCQLAVEVASCQRSKSSVSVLVYVQEGVGIQLL